jgi:cytochrome c
MKKRTLSALAIASMFAMSTLVSCGGEAPAEGGEATDSTEETTPAADEDTEAKEDEEETNETSDALPGEARFTDAGCVACHQVDQKIVGPALKDIAVAYADNSEGLAAFLNGEGEAIVDPAQAAVMTPQLENTKAMTEEERTELVDYIMSTAK